MVRKNDMSSAHLERQEGLGDKIRGVHGNVEDGDDVSIFLIALFWSLSWGSATALTLLWSPSLRKEKAERPVVVLWVIF